ncbi:prepilin-type N-terminal cleavage/methylation domain-containing protein [bacterium]|nr:MAG: prepilin-type N-terminal cleavage/methylation domain-containing protein [bacterium]
MKKAFTLIELLVVIAIIAILAAILFPVFAQAKAAAKSSVDISNLKQNATAFLIYSGDSDDYFPQAFQVGWGYPWPQTVQPYTKSFAIFRSPLDGTGQLKDTGSAEPTWAGIGISYGVNSYLDNTTSWPPIVAGPIAPMHLDWAGVKSTLSQTQMTDVAGTILIADRFNSDQQKITPARLGNSSAWAGSFFCWRDYDGVEAGRVPDGTNPNKEISAYPNGANGGVSVVNAGKANFAFTDGHTKSMSPPQTNPDAFNQKDKNLWNGLR